MTELSLEQQAQLLAGQNFWSTAAIEDAEVPSIVMTDGPHGIRRQTGSFEQLSLGGRSAPATCFPPAVAVGNSWDPLVAEQLGAAVGVEARALGVHVVLGPGVNIKRSPLCGRNFEYYSEDPLLSGVLGAAHVRALQSQGVGASVKHFAANNQETDRMRISADVDERTLREIYFPAFERVVVEADPATVMCSYNKVNGVYASQNRWLLTEVLRDEWGFGGLVVSDWGAVQDRVAAVAAGLDLEMPGPAPAGIRMVVDAVQTGDLDEAIVGRAAERVLALGALVRPPTDGFDVDAHHQLARELAAGCAVLLKNERGVLPLDDTGSIAVIGAFAETPRYQGGGSSHINPTRVDTALDGIRAAAEGREVSYAAGFSLDGSGDDAALRAEAATAAATADVAVVFAGLADAEESEGFDRDSIELPATQIELIRAVAAAASKTVVVLSHGGVVSMEGWHDEVEAILDCFLLGQAGGAAIADLLVGAVNPSGRLAETIPLRLADTPSYLNFPGEQGHVRYGEGVMVGYRWFTTVDRPVRYPFGHGLSYTTFQTSDLRVEATGGDTARVSVTVTNTGDRPGRYVVQIYVATETGPVRRPGRELRAFAKVTLAPGESETVRVDLDRRAFAYYDVSEADWVVPAGRYAVQVGQDAATVIAEAAIELAGDGRVPKLTMDASLEECLAHPAAAAEVTRLLAGPAERAGGINEELLRLVGSMPIRKILQVTGVPMPDELHRLLAGS